MIKKILDLSTGHVHERTASIIDNDDMEDVSMLPFRYAVHKHGWLIFLADQVPHIDLFEAYEMEEVHAVMTYALEQGCSFINFDQDAEEVEALVTFEW